MFSPEKKLNKQEQEGEIKIGEFDLARYYLRTDQGRRMVKWNDMNLADISDFLQHPDQLAELFNLDPEDVEDVHRWKEQVTSQEMEKKNAYEKLKKLHPENTLFKDSFESIPPHFISVFHHTSRDRIERIAREGLKPLKTAFSEEDKKNEGREYFEKHEKVDQIFDKYAPSGFSRSGAVYASDDFHTAWYNNGDVILELKVDPKKVAVAEGELRTEASVHAHNVEYYGQKYWEDSISLYDFKKLPLQEQMNKYILPEVVVPFEVDEKHMRIFSVSPEASTKKPA